MHTRLVALSIVAACQPSSKLGYLAPPSGSDGRVGLGALDRALADSLRTSYTHREEASPIALVPSDGNELAMTALDAKVTIEGPLAHTELHFTFRNTEARIREGRFSIALPVGAAVDRFAMKNGETWREARIVSRTQGREVYETFLKRRVDPALLEQDLGNRFSARVFPIPGSSDKEIIIGYDHAVSSARPYVLALHGMPAIPTFRVEIDHDGDHRTIAKAKLAPDDVVVSVDDATMAVEADGSFVARVSPTKAAAADPLDRVLILVDTSASRAPVMRKQVELVRRLVSSLGDHPITIAAFDHAIDEVYRGPASAATVDSIFDHGALGASDLGKALAYAAGTGIPRVVLVGDGTPTLGESDPAKLAALVAMIERVDAIQVGDNIDADVLRPIVAAAKHAGAILDGRDPERALTQLASAAPAAEPIEVASATEIWPTTTHGVAPNEPIWVFGHRAAHGALAIRVGERTIRLSPRATTGSRIRRAVAGAELAALTEQLVAAEPAAQSTLAARIEKIALANNLVSARTSLLVLETDADEQRFLGPRTAESAPPAQPTQLQAPDGVAIQMPAASASVTESPDKEGETIMIRGSAPIIDQGSTKQGITITSDYISNIAIGRTFAGVLGAAAGSQADGYGLNVTGASSLENVYVIDGRANGRFSARGSHPMPTLLPETYERTDTSPAEPPAPPPPPPAPYIGPMKQVMTDIAEHRPEQALVTATRWELSNPGDLAAIIALGEALEARGATTLAARAYGSILDLYPNRSELLRAAGERLDRVSGARSLAIDAYRRAIHERPDQASSYRLLAYALYRDGHGAEALDTLAEGIKHTTRPSIAGILGEDVHVIEAAMHPKAHPMKPSMRMILSWETDDNDVDLHVFDNAGNHTWYGERAMRSGGSLRDDITSGFGPEMFEVDEPKAYPYKIEINYFARGPMGVGLGTVQVVKFDGTKLTVEDRPFILQVDNATVGLGSVTR